MSIDLFEQGASTYIPTLIVSLIITLGAYCAFPLIFAKTTEKIITKRKYKTLCYCVNLVIMFLFVAINGSASSGGPYILWTWVFSSRGIKALEKRELLDEHQNDEAMSTPQTDDKSKPTNDNIKFVCSSCGTKMTGWYKVCPQCKSIDTIIRFNETDEHTQAGNSIDKTSIELLIEEPKSTEEIITKSDFSYANIKDTDTNLSNEQTNRKLFCRYCGERIPIDSIYCECCGKLLSRDQSSSCAPTITCEKKTDPIIFSTVTNNTDHKYKKVIPFIILFIIIIAALVVAGLGVSHSSPFTFVNRTFVKTFSELNGVSLGMAKEEALELLGGAETISTPWCITIKNPDIDSIRGFKPDEMVLIFDKNERLTKISMRFYRAYGNYNYFYQGLISDFEKIYGKPDTGYDESTKIWKGTNCWINVETRMGHYLVEFYQPA